MNFLDSASRQEDPRPWFLSTVVDRGLAYSGPVEGRHTIMAKTVLDQSMEYTRDWLCIPVSGYMRVQSCSMGGDCQLSIPLG